MRCKQHSAESLLMPRRSLIKWTLNWLLATGGTQLHTFMVMVMIELNGYCNANLIWECYVRLYALHLMHMVYGVKSMIRDDAHSKIEISRYNSMLSCDLLHSNKIVLNSKMDFSIFWVCSVHGSKFIAFVTVNKHKNVVGHHTSIILF